MGIGGGVGGCGGAGATVLPPPQAQHKSWGEAESQVKELHREVFEVKSSHPTGGPEAHPPLDVRMR